MFLKFGGSHFFCLQILLFFIAQIDSRYAERSIYQSDIESTSHHEEQLFEGDIIGWHVGDEDANGQHTAISDRNFRWPNAVVQYKLSSEFLCNERCIIYEAMREIEMKTCVTFKDVHRHRSVGHFVTISMSKEGPASYVGYSPPAEQQLLICSRCFGYTGGILHELMHTLGFLHEHTRIDRDSYVTINETNIKPGQRHNFKRHDFANVTTQGFGYDYQSVTHYPSNAFSVDDNLKTIIVKGDEGVEIGQRRHLSEMDVQKINTYYNCSKNKIGCLDILPNCMGAFRFSEKCGEDESFRRKCCRSCNMCQQYRNTQPTFDCQDPVQRCNYYVNSAKKESACKNKLSSDMRNGVPFYGRC